MELKIFAPSLQLRSFIKCYYVSESHYSEYVKDVFFPDGSVEVVFHAGLDFYRDDEKECPAKVIGQITQPLTMTAIGEGKTFGIWFLPHAFSLFSGTPMNELNDKAIPLDTIFSQVFIDLVKKCLFESDLNGLVEATDIYLSGRLKSSPNPVKEKIVEYAIQYIQDKKAATDLDKLVKDCNISNRYLQKVFIERVGFSPKFFIRIVRFQHALHLLTRHRPASLTDLTYQAGYYDQAHFIRDFKEFTGSAPSQFHLGKHPINQYFLGL